MTGPLALPNVPPRPDPVPDKGWATVGTGERLQLATPWARLAARFIDYVIPLIIWILVVNQLAAFNNMRLELVALLIGTGFGVVYEVVLIALTGRTLGKIALGIAIVRIDNGDRPGWLSSFHRCSLPVALGWAADYTPGASGIVLLLLGLACYGSVIWNRSRQGWHDMFARTIVVIA